MAHKGRPYHRVHFLPTRSAPIPATYDEFVSSQPDHTAVLLPRLSITRSDIYDFVTSVLHFEDVLIATDGGATDILGAFGWVISLKSGLRLASGLMQRPHAGPRSQGNVSKSVFSPSYPPQMLSETEARKRRDVH